MTEIHSKESMENHLTDEQRCTARAFEKLAECSLVPTIALFRFTEFTDDFLNQVPDSYFGFLTVFVKQIVKSFEANQVGFLFCLHHVYYTINFINCIV